MDTANPDTASFTVMVNGSVRDEYGEHIAAAVVMVRTGTIGDMRESAGTLTNAEGRFTAEVDVDAGGEMLISARSEGHVDQYQRVAVSDNVALSVDLTLPVADAMTCVSGICSTDGISLTGLPDGVTGSARTFSPVDDIDSFPGSFDASGGDLLESGGFAWVGLEDRTGNPVTVLTSPVTMELQLARESWPAVRDVVSGNGRIDVPYYAFDAALGTWNHESDAVLFDSSGNLLAEEDLPLILQGTFSQGIFARGVVEHFSYWNIDWPIAARSATRVAFFPAASSATLQGTTYNGRSTGLPLSSNQSTGGNGGNGADNEGSAFCFDGPRSEADDEDIDQNGIVGELETGELVVRSNGKLYRLSTLALSAAAGDCGEPAGPLTRIDLTDDNLLVAQLCTVSGRMLDLSGAPVVGAIVSARLSAQVQDFREALCTDGCNETTSSDANGNYSLTIPVAGSTRISGVGLVTPPAGASSAFRAGETRINNCPTELVDLLADEGTDLYPLQISVSDTAISWNPSVTAAKVFVTATEQYLKWAVGGPLLSPAQYGVVPGAAIQDIPSDGNPPRESIETGDLIRIFAKAPGDMFYEKSYEGLLQVP